MFTGIVAETAKIVEVIRGDRSARIAVQRVACLAEPLDVGASVSIDGVCLTVETKEDDVVWFDVIASTLDRTTLSRAEAGQVVNLERSFSEGDEIGGHIVSGHVDAAGKILDVEVMKDNCRIAIQLDPKWMRYVFEHGFIAINGCSLTVNQVDRAESWFDVWLIPETLRRTNLNAFKQGGFANVEIPRDQQVQVDTVYAAVTDTLTAWLEKNKASNLELDGLVKSLIQATPKGKKISNDRS